MVKSRKSKPALPPAFEAEDYDPGTRAKLAALSERFGYRDRDGAKTEAENPAVSRPTPTADEATGEEGGGEDVAPAASVRASDPAAPQMNAAPAAAARSNIAKPVHRQRKITFEASDALLHALEMEAARRRVSQRLLLVEGLAALGLPVPEEDRRDHRRRRRG